MTGKWEELNETPSKASLGFAEQRHIKVEPYKVMCMSGPLIPSLIATVTLHLQPAFLAQGQTSVW
jgi:hypothetical protein